MQSKVVLHPKMNQMNTIINPLNEKHFTADEVADTFRMSKATVYRHRKSGALKGLKLGSKLLFRESDVIAFVSNAEIKEQVHG